MEVDKQKDQGDRESLERAIHVSAVMSVAMRAMTRQVISRMVGMAGRGCVPSVHEAEVMAEEATYALQRNMLDFDQAMKRGETESLVLTPETWREDVDAGMTMMAVATQSAVKRDVH